MIYLRRSEIDEELWNRRIQDARNPRIYATTWYLDAVTTNWAAYVGKNYEWIFPIPFAYKWNFIPWVCQPNFTQQLGFFGEISQEEQRLILQKLAFYPKVQLNLFENISELQMLEKTNILLNLNLTYEQLIQNYSDLRKREIKKGKKQGLVVRESNDVEFAVQNLEKVWKDRNFWNPKWKIVLTKLLSAVQKEERLKVKVCEFGEEMIGIGIFFIDFQRVIYLAGGSVQNYANSMIFDKTIQEFSGNEIFLDFEGSEIEGVKRYYQSFGKTESEIYYVFQSRFWKN